MIKSALQSSLTNDVKYRNLDTFNVPSSEYLISTTVLAEAASSVTFDVSGLGSQFKHLKLVISARSSNSGTDLDESIIRFNSDSGNNYSNHQIYGTNGLAVTSTGQSGISYTNVFIVSKAENADTFAGVEIDILDAFSTSKNKTLRALSGYYTSSSSYRNLITFRSGAWFSTSAINSIYIAPILGPIWVD
jgi:hypothetical protein